MALTSEADYAQALEAFHILRRGLEALRRDVTNDEVFAVLAEGPIVEMSVVLKDMALYRASTPVLEHCSHDADPWSCEMPCATCEHDCCYHGLEGCGVCTAEARTHGCVVFKDQNQMEDQ